MMIQIWETRYSCEASLTISMKKHLNYFSPSLEQFNTLSYASIKRPKRLMAPDSWNLPRKKPPAIYYNKAKPQANLNKKVRMNLKWMDDCWWSSPRSNGAKFLKNNSRKIDRKWILKSLKNWRISSKPIVHKNVICTSPLWALSSLLLAWTILKRRNSKTTIMKSSQN